MPGYTPTTFHKFQHKPPSRLQDAPHTWNNTVYGKHIQLATHQSSVLKINSVDTNRVGFLERSFDEWLIGCVCHKQDYSMYVGRLGDGMVVCAVIYEIRLGCIQACILQSTSCVVPI